MSQYKSHFGINNIPFGIASSSKHPKPQAVTRIDDSVIFLAELGSIRDIDSSVLLQPTLNAFAALGRTAHTSVREAVQKAVKDKAVPDSAAEDISAVKLHLPLSSGDFTDFSCSPHHNRRAGQALLGRSADLPPGFFHQPLGYAGRCSSLAVSGTPILRPMGQYFTHGNEGLTKDGRRNVTYGPCKWMDYEMEMGVYIGKPVPRGSFVHASEALEHTFGYVMLNDWSARCIQQFEMIPVGPLNSKHAATTISPWVITPDALQPFRVPGKQRESGKIAPYLAQEKPQSLDVAVSVEAADDTGASWKTWSKTNTTVMDWTFEQLIAHQSSAGQGLRSGDLLGIGTISGPTEDSRGCLLEEFVPGQEPRRGYVRDNEVIRLVGSCGEGVGFGDCTAQLLPATSSRVVWQD